MFFDSEVHTRPAAHKIARTPEPAWPRIEAPSLRHDLRSWDHFSFLSHTFYAADGSGDPPTLPRADHLQHAALAAAPRSGSAGRSLNSPGLPPNPSVLAQTANATLDQIATCAIVASCLRRRLDAARVPNVRVRHAPLTGREARAERLRHAPPPNMCSACRPWPPLTQGKPRPSRSSFLPPLTDASAKPKARWQARLPNLDRRPAARRYAAQIVGASLLARLMKRAVQSRPK